MVTHERDPVLSNSDPWAWLPEMMNEQCSLHLGQAFSRNTGEQRQAARRKQVVSFPSQLHLEPVLAGVKIDTQIEQLAGDDLVVRQAGGVIDLE